MSRMRAMAGKKPDETIYIHDIKARGYGEKPYFFRLGGLAPASNFLFSALPIHQVMLHAQELLQAGGFGEFDGGDIIGADLVAREKMRLM